MRRGFEQHLALDQGLAHQPELVILEVTQPAMHKLSGSRTGALRQIIFFAKNDGHAPPCRIAGNACPIDTAADDKQVDDAGFSTHDRFSCNP